MSPSKNDQILLYCHFNEIIKAPGTSFQYPELSRTHVRNKCLSARWYLTEFYFTVLRIQKKKG